jgi:hypothetical protein
MPEMSFTPGHRSDLLLSKPGAVGRQGQEGTRERSQVSGSLKRRGANWEKARRRENPKMPTDQGNLIANCKTALAPHNCGKASAEVSRQAFGEGDSGGDCDRGAAENVTLGRWVPGNTTALWGRPLPKGPNIPARRDRLAPAPYDGFPPADMPSPSPQGQVSTLRRVSSFRMPLPGKSPLPSPPPRRGEGGGGGAVPEQVVRVFIRRGETCLMLTAKNILASQRLTSGSRKHILTVRK